MTIFFPTETVNSALIVFIFERVLYFLNQKCQGIPPPEITPPDQPVIPMKSRSSGEKPVCAFNVPSASWTPIPLPRTNVRRDEHLQRAPLGLRSIDVHGLSKTHSCTRVRIECGPIRSLARRHAPAWWRVHRPFNYLRPSHGSTDTPGDRSRIPSRHGGLTARSLGDELRKSLLLWLPPPRRPTGDDETSPSAL